jgi:hypothetical protein
MIHGSSSQFIELISHLILSWIYWIKYGKPIPKPKNKKINEPKKRFNVIFPESLLSDVDEYRGKYGMKRSELLAAAAEQFISSTLRTHRGIRRQPSYPANHQHLDFRYPCPAENKQKFHYNQSKPPWMDPSHLRPVGF